MVMLVGTSAGDEADDPEDLMENNDAIEAVEQCDLILEECENVPERAEDFAASVMEKVESMRAWIVKHDRVTPKIVASLENMESAVDRCIERGW